MTPKLKISSVAMFLLIAAGCTSSDKTTPVTDTKQVAFVKTTSLQNVAYSPSIEVSGVIAPKNEASISAEISGYKVVKVSFSVSDVVKKGQVLVTLDSESLRQEIAAQKAVIKKYESSLSLLKFNAENSKKLWEAKSGSEQDYIQATSLFNQTTADLQAAVIQLDILNTKLKKAQIVAPYDGVISAKSVAEGAVVASGAELFKIVKNSEYEWRAELSPEEALNIKEGDSAFINAGNPLIKGFVTKISPAIDSASKKVIVYCSLVKPLKLISGQYVSGKIVSPERKAQVVLQSAVFNENAASYVFAINANSHKVHKQKIDIAKSAIVINDNYFYEVTSKIEPALLLVGEGPGLLEDGQSVDFQNKGGAQ